MRVLQPGQKVLDRYVVEEMEGRESGSVVYRGRNVHLGHAVQIKVHAKPDDRESMERFERSAHLMTRVRSPHVVALLDHWIGEGLPVIVTEFVEGQSLRDLLRSHGPMPWPGAMAMSQQLLKGLDAMHDVGVLHRNLKPDNVVVVDGTPPTVKITDLGLVKSVTGGARRITQAGMIVGTPAYMAPEQLQEKHIDGRTDVYAAALVIYEIMTGGLPRRTDGTIADLIQTVRSPPPPPRAPGKLPPIPEPVVAALMQALAIDPNRRPPTAESFMKKLAAATPKPGQGQSTSMPRPEVRERRDSKPIRLSADSHAWRTMEDRGSLRADSKSWGLRAQSQALEGQERARVRAVLAAMVPPSELSRREVSRWLTDLIPSGQSFRVGDRFWVGLLTSTSDAHAQQYGRAVTQQLRGRFGANTPVRARMVGPEFRLARASLDGSAPPPPEVLELLEQIARGGS